MSRFDTAERLMERRISALEERIADLEEDVAKLNMLKATTHSADDRSERARKAWVTRKANAAREAMGHGE